MLSEKPWKLERMILVLLGTCVGFSLGGMLLALAQHFNGDKKLDDSSLLELLIMTLSIQGSILMATGLVLWWHQTDWRQAFGFTAQGAGKAVLLGVAAAVIFLPIGMILFDASQSLIGHLPERMITQLHLKETQPAMQSLQKTITWGSRVYFIAFSVLIAPLAEEVLFRGIFYPTIKQMGFPRLAYLVTAVLFAAIHWPWITFVPLFALGLALAWLYERTDNLLAPITAHGVFNGINIVVFYYGDDFASLLHRWFHAHS